MVKWSDPPDKDYIFVQAESFSKNRGMQNEDDTEQPSPHDIYVDDNLMANIRHRMSQTLAAVVEAMVVIMSLPKLALCPCAIALDKWLLLEVHVVQILLGLLWNTRDVTVSITPEFRIETVHLIQYTWHDGRESFEIRKLELLVGKLGRIGYAYRPIYHLVPMMYASVASALCENHDFLRLLIVGIEK